MIIDCVSDLHGYYPKLEGGDLLIVAGDLTTTGEHHSYYEFCSWLERQDYEEKIIIAGNHDNGLVDGYEGVKYGFDFSGWATYLCDSGTEFEGLKIWGSPWTRRFEDMNPHCMAFTCETEEELAEKWKLIPSDIDILITHSPAQGVLDEIEGDEWDEYTEQYSINNVGSSSLIKPLVKSGCRLHICGHIHESYGKFYNPINGITYVNASHVNERYEPVNKPIRVIL